MTKKHHHKAWVKSCHWIVTISFLVLAFTGVMILMVHPRLYWGEVGNDLTPALFELPISRNYQHGGWEKVTPFFDGAQSPVSASRTYDIFNQNGWGRSLHFLAGWFLVLTGLTYLILGLFSGHFRRNVFPRTSELGWKHIVADLRDHLKMWIPRASGGPDYGTLQKITYVGVIFIAFPVIIMTGFTMAPAITNGFPFLLKLFGGYQSARTIHFFATVLLLLFLIVHIIMVIRSGFKAQMLSMTISRSHETQIDTDAP